MASAGRARWKPPPWPLADTTRPAATMRRMIFQRYGSGTPVTAASSLARMEDKSPRKARLDIARRAYSAVWVRLREIKGETGFRAARVARRTPSGPFSDAFCAGLTAACQRQTE